jgi:hypothetical protein
MALIDPYEQNSGGLIDPFETQAEQPAPEKGFFTRVGEDIGKRWENIKNIDAPTYGQASLRGVGQVAGMGNDIIGQGLVSAYKTIVPDVAQEAIASGAKKVFSTPLVQGAVKGVTEAYGGFKEANPNLASDIEAVANIGMFVPAAKGIGMAGKEGINIAKDVAYAVGKPASQILDSTIRQSVEKAIRPSVSKQGTVNLTQKYYENASNAVKNIVTNRGKLVLTDAEGIALEGQLPQTLKQFSEAVGQTKKAIYDQYHNMAAEAGKQGATFDTKHILSKLDDVSSDLKFNPQVREYANSLKKEVAELHGQPPEVIEARIADLNQSLVGFFEGRVGAAKVKVDASVAGLMREELDDIITKTLEQSGYQGLKKSYGSLKAIEKDVAHRSGIYARLNKKGLIDFTDIFTSGEIVAGLATMNPALLAKGVTMKAVKEYIKYVNDPNHIVKTMFKDVDDILKREAAGYKSASFRGAERRLPENPLTKSDMPPVPPGSYYYKKTSLPSTEVKGGRVKGEPYGPPSSKWEPPPTKPKGLPPGQGFSLSGEPYTPDVIDAIFTSWSRPIPERPALDIPRRDAILELPAGQGFNVEGRIVKGAQGEPFKLVGGENVKLKGLRNYQKALKRKAID